MRTDKNKKVVLTKEKSNIIYGIAACLMVFHHLFAFPERIPNTYVAVLDFNFLHVETMIAYFGKICISLYAFISGYGLTQKAKHVSSVFLMIKNQIEKFYIHYWMVFVIFVPYGIVKSIYEINIGKLLGNFIGWYCTYNAEWWYVKQYLVMLLLFPFLYMIYEKLERSLPQKLRVVIGTISVCILAITVETLRYIMVFVIGMFFAKEQIFEIIDGKLRMKNMIALVNLISIFGVRTVLGGSGQLDIILTPAFIYSVCILTDIDIAKKYINPVIKTIGKYSIYIWLIHTFYIYYYFQKVIFAAQYSIIIFIWTMILCVSTSAIINNLLIKCFKYKEKIIRVNFNERKS